MVILDLRRSKLKLIIFTINGTANGSGQRVDSTESATVPSYLCDDGSTVQPCFDNRRVSSIRNACS